MAFSYLNDKEEDRISKEVDKNLRMARSAISKLEDINRKMAPAKICGHLGRISPQIYRNQTCDQDDAISRLPAEIKQMIWSHLTFDADRIAFGLTCKDQAAVLDDVWELQKDHRPKKVSEQHRLMVLVRLMRWVPHNKRLCFNCGRFRDRYQGIWGGDTMYETLAKSLDKNEQIATEFRLTKRKSTVPKDAMIKGPRCPTCVHRVNFQQIKHKQNHRELKALLGKHKIDN